MIGVVLLQPPGGVDLIATDDDNFALPRPLPPPPFECEAAANWDPLLVDTTTLLAADGELTIVACGCSFFMVLVPI